MLELTQTYLGHRGSIYDIVHFNDNQFITAGGDGWVVLWGNGPNGQLIAKAPSQIFCLEHIKGTNLVVAGTMNGILVWLDVASNELVKSIQLSSFSIYTTVFHHNMLYVGDASGTIYSIDPLRMKVIRSNILSSKAVRSIAVNDEQLFVGSSDGNIYRIDQQTLIEQSIVKEAHDSSVFCIQIIQDDIWSGGRDARIRVAKQSENKTTKVIDAHWFTVNDLKYIEKYDFVASASRDKRIRIWDAATHNLLFSTKAVKPGHINSVNRLLYIPEVQTLLSVSDDKSIKRWTTTL